MSEPAMPEPALLLPPALLRGLALAARQPPGALLRAAEQAGRAAMGHALCTGMLFDAGRMTVRRMYSSDPAAYPVGGEKPKRDTAWGGQVLLRQELFVGEGEAAIRRHFDDHALILGLGLRSVVNVPVLAGGHCLGTLNFLWREAAVQPGWRALAQWLGLVVVPEWAAAAAPGAARPRSC